MSAPGALVRLTLFEIVIRGLGGRLALSQVVVRKQY